MSQQFPPAARLRTKRQFDAVQAGGRRISSRYLTLLGQPNGLPHDRLGVIASRRVGGAIRRNRAKRRLREMFRRQPAVAPVTRAFDLVVIARADCVDASFEALAQDFSAALRRLRGRPS